MIVISGEIVRNRLDSDTPAHVSFIEWDDGDVFNLIRVDGMSGNAPGTIIFTDHPFSASDKLFGNENDKVRIVIEKTDDWLENCQHPYMLHGFVKMNGKWEKTLVHEIPVKKDLYSRSSGLIETDALKPKSVSIFGLGSGGSPIGVELAKAGIGHFFLVDGDRMEVVNTVRHSAGISYTGRYKTKAEKDLIKEKNPYASVCTLEEYVSWENIETVRDIVKKVDIVICATDDRPSKLIVNRLCVEESKPCIVAGAFRRAYGGQVHFVRPNQTPCFQCFLMLLPEQAMDQEISSRRATEGLAYTDRPVAIEPGLSTDIAPISLMVVKLAIQELLKDQKTTLRSLDEDLVAPWFIWLNRREPNTQYASLEPLEYNVNGMHVLRWYGISVERHPACPVCGDFIGEQAKLHQIDLS
jgi:molybdopterin/thiamine biosynthesis adenylyltransferase